MFACCATACHSVHPGILSPADTVVAQAAGEIATERSLDVASFPAHSVGVTPFGVRTGDTVIAPLAYGLADLLLTDLSRSRQLEIVDRLRINSILRELALADSGRLDTVSATRMGRLVGARRLVIGALGEKPDSTLLVQVQIANVADGSLRDALSATAPLGRILDAEKTLAFRVFEQLGVTLSPAERAEVAAKPTSNLAALLAYSRGVRNEIEGRYEEARREYRATQRLDPSFTRARERLSDVDREESGGSMANAQATRRAQQLRRTAGIAVDQVNQMQLSSAAAAASSAASDPSFPSQTITVFITITATP
jgi:TolB-like protein